MQAYKYTGTLDPEGRIIPSEPIALAAGEPFEFVLWHGDNAETIAMPQASSLQEALIKRPQASLSFSPLPSTIQILEEWFAKADEVTDAFDVTSAVDEDELRWAALREKHGL